MKFKDLFCRKDIVTAGIMMSVASAAIVFVAMACIRG